MYNSYVKKYIDPLKRIFGKIYIISDTVVYYNGVDLYGKQTNLIANVTSLMAIVTCFVITVTDLAANVMILMKKPNINLRVQLDP